jgi:hypothetical protein
MLPAWPHGRSWIRDDVAVGGSRRDDAEMAVQHVNASRAHDVVIPRPRDALDVPPAACVRDPAGSRTQQKKRSAMHAHVVAMAWQTRIASGVLHLMPLVLASV